MQRYQKVFEKDNPASIDRVKDGYRDSQTKYVLYNPRDYVCKIYLTFTLSLKQRSKSIMNTTKTKQTNPRA
jgi:hypothetical protein